jgi:predicted TIM-barrel fold metal-dependent hydrolase
MHPLITLEEHFLSESVRSASGDAFKDFPPPLVQKLLSLDDERITDMDAGNVSIQVLSHTPTVRAANLETCHQANNELHNAVTTHKPRYAGFAMLPMNDPLGAADELTRCIKDLGFVGALVNNHTNGRFYDSEFFWPVFVKAQELDVPLYLHPSFASDEMTTPYTGNYPNKVAKALADFGWGWHSETAVHVLRLYAAGVFDRFPHLKIIIGHMGEMLPFMLERVVRFTTKWGGWGQRERGFQRVWDENLWITTSGMFDIAPMACLLRTTKIERILYSVDYPFETHEDGVAFMKKLAESGLVTEEDLGLIAHRNAENLMGLSCGNGNIGKKLADRT